MAAINFDFRLGRNNERTRSIVTTKKKTKRLIATKARRYIFTAVIISNDTRRSADDGRAIIARKPSAPGQPTRRIYRIDDIVDITDVRNGI